MTLMPLLRSCPPYFTRVVHSLPHLGRALTPSFTHRLTKCLLCVTSSSCATIIKEVSFKGDAGKSSERRGYGGLRGPYRGGGGHRGGFSNGEIGEAEEGQPQRAFDRCNGIGRGNEFKREGSGRGNWGTQTDELA
ncbi:hypothetical protein D0Y65_003639 [Glycine soja]|uniref:Hyaluronan/mRNA-binding protein domain-containing protein n=1 Tax=Glycine soja TaxID=3848 RepID=A0A445LMY6_GLYSO|nr:hypothetical protein D0Y65_003639 [Glycine soja]